MDRPRLVQISADFAVFQGAARMNQPHPGPICGLSPGKEVGEHPRQFSVNPLKEAVISFRPIDPISREVEGDVRRGLLQQAR